MENKNKIHSTDFLFIALILCCLAIAMFMGCSNLKAQTVNLSCRDTTIHKSKQVTVTVEYDSTYSICDTIVTPSQELRGFYVAYDAFTLGSAASENAFLSNMKRLNVNMLNYYARAKLYSSTDRDKLAAFVKKAKEQYGIVKVTVDVRLTNSQEYPSWVAYYQKYGGTISMINPLTEIEPYNNTGTASAPVYDYANFFNVLQKMDALTKQYNTQLYYYEGWVGKNYSKPQAAVDSMVLHCGAIFVSNYVSESRYNSSVWDGSMINRVGYGGADYGGITQGCKNVGKKSIDLVEIQSIEPSFLMNYYSCPATSTKKCKPFFGPTWEATKTKFNQVSSAETKSLVKLIGKTIFYTTLLPQTGQ